MNQPQHLRPQNLHPQHHHQVNSLNEQLIINEVTEYVVTKLLLLSNKMPLRKPII